MFQAVQPLSCSSARDPFTKVTTSPTLELSIIHFASAVDAPVQPWLTFARPCEPVDQGRRG